MLGYRLYVLNQQNRIKQAIEILCEDDAAAISEAKAQWRGEPLELWERARVVKRFATNPHEV